MSKLRRILKTILPTLAAASLAIAPAAHAASALSKIADSKKVQVGWAEWKPMEYKDIATGDLKGVLVAMATEVSKRLGAEPEFVQDNWTTLTAGIAAGKFQISMMGISEGRARVVDFSKPLYHVPFTVIVPSASKATTFEDVNTSDNTIAVTTGSTTDELLTDLEKKGAVKAHIVRIKDVGGAILSLTSNKVAAFASSTDDLAQITAQQPSLKIVKGEFGASTFGVALPKGDKELKAAVDHAVEAMISDGTIDKFLKEYKVAGTIAGGE